MRYCTNPVQLSLLQAIRETYPLPGSRTTAVIDFQGSVRVIELTVFFVSLKIRLWKSAKAGEKMKEGAARKVLKRRRESKIK